MKFDDLDSKMRVFETAHDLCVLPGLFIVARLDGRGFTRLTKELHSFDAPFDERFRDLMLATTQHLMNCGFRVVYAYTQSDEISLLLHRDETLFDRKLRKLDSVLAGEASASFSLRLGAQACFHSRVSQLPTDSLVIEYFRWRQEDATRNALNAHCYWALRKEGKSVRGATEELLSFGLSEKNELLFERGTNFNKVPMWQRRGIGLFWEIFEKDGVNPTTGQSTKASRRRISIVSELPMKESYETFLAERLREATSSTGRKQ